MSCQISGNTQWVAIFGHPLTYTLSPAFQNAGLEALRFNAVYLPVPVAPGGFEAAFRGFQAGENSLGANITNPFKQAVIPLLDSISPQARAIGAVNTVWRKGRRWMGGNSDWAGFLASAADLGAHPFSGRNVILLGAGGAGATRKARGSPRGHALGPLDHGSRGGTAPGKRPRASPWKSPSPEAAPGKRPKA